MKNLIAALSSLALVAILLLAACSATTQTGNKATAGMNETGLFHALASRNVSGSGTNSSKTNHTFQLFLQKDKQKRGISLVSLEGVGVTSEDAFSSTAAEVTADDLDAIFASSVSDGHTPHSPGGTTRLAPVYELFQACFGGS